MKRIISLATPGLLLVAATMANATPDIGDPEIDPWVEYARHMFHETCDDVGLSQECHDVIDSTQAWIACAQKYVVTEQGLGHRPNIIDLQITTNELTRFTDLPESKGYTVDIVKLYLRSTPTCSHEYGRPLLIEAQDLVNA